MDRRRRNEALQMGVILLLSEMLSFGINRIPPITLSFVAGQVFLLYLGTKYNLNLFCHESQVKCIFQTLLYLGIINAPWGLSDICISADKVLGKKEWRRLFFSSLEHGDDMHLYYNMASFLIKGRTLEKKYGSINFGILLILLMLMSNVIYIVIGKVFADILFDESIRLSCAVGFSGNNGRKNYVKLLAFATNISFNF